ncbi:MAG: TIGR03016 family PEP-CTERM system-associated outer membrane protein [Desulfuromonadales bacterium]|nr:TIGR03016 family PEP-CTERM system-associated outer membrane protein [Desulfuromonadales bacterium]
MSAILFGGELLWTSASASAADMDFRPSLSISEEFNDNIFEVSANRRSEMITRVQPGATFRYQTPLWIWNTSYNFDYINYARNSRDSEFNHNGSLSGNITLPGNFLFIDLSDTYHRVTTDVSRDVATSSSLFLNQTDQNIATISPYLLWRLRGDNTLRTGYRFTDTRYWGPGVESREQGAFADLNHEISNKFSISAGYAFTHLESQPSQYNKHDISGGFRYEYAERSFVFGQIGNTWQQFNGSTDVSYLFWNAGITHDLGLAVATLETRVQTAVDPLSVSTKETSYSGRLERTLQYGMVGFATSYTEYLNIQTDKMDRRKLSFSGTGRYEILQHLTANLGVTAERFYFNTGTGFLYHLNATGGLSYTFKHDITLGLNYTFDTQRNDINTASGAIETNRVVVEVRKTF